MWLLNAVGLNRSSKNNLAEATCENIRGSLYSVEGLECDLLDEEEDFQITDTHMLVGEADENEEATWSFKIENISQLQHHQDDMLQFVYQKKIGGDFSTYGIQTSEPDMAMTLMSKILKKIFKRCEWEAFGEGAFAIYNLEEKSFVPVSKEVTCGLKSIASGASNDRYLTVTDLNGDVLFFETLGHHQQLWMMKDSMQLSFWGKREQEEISNTYLVEFKPPKDDDEEESHNGVESLFRIISEYVGEEIDDTGSISESEVSGDECHALERSQDSENSDSDSGSSSSGEDSDSSEDSLDSNDSRRRNSKIVYKDPTSASAEDAWNRFMKIGQKRTFVYRATNKKRGSKADPDSKFEMKVFGHDDNPSIMRDVATIDSSKFKYGSEAIVPKAALLHDAQTKMILSSAVDSDKAYLMDLETEKIIQGFDAEFQAIHKMVNTFKGGDNSSDPTFLCHNSRNIFMMDTRLETGGRTNTLTYQKKQGFSVIATDQNGHFAVGSTFGTIRLFDGEENKDGKFKRAKSQIDVVKEPIIGLDVTDEGEWVVATTRSYLVLLDVRLKDSNRTGFEVSLPKDSVKPIILKISRKDVMNYGLSEISFAAAKFDSTGTRILTHTGNICLIFDLKMAKKRVCDYTVRIMPDYIKDLSSSSQEEVIIAYPKEVGVLGKEVSSRKR